MSLDDLSSIFAKHLIEHIQTGKRQIQGKGTMKLLNALYLYTQEQIRRVDAPRYKN